MKRTSCAAVGCSKPPWARGLCRSHADGERNARKQGKAPGFAIETGPAATRQCRANWRRIAHFKAWVAGTCACAKGSPLVLDSGEVWKPERWELDPIRDFLGGEYRAVWLIVPEGNGKTTLTAAFVLYLLEHQTTPEIPIGSATTTQAETLFRQIEGFVTRSEKDELFKLVPGLRRIDCLLSRGHCRVYPHNEKSGDGVIPSASILDEGHLHPSLRLYRVWKGKYRKRKGPVFGISTAGEPGSEFEDLRSKLLQQGELTKSEGRKQQYKRVVMGDTVLHDWGVRDARDARDVGVVLEANPLSLVDRRELETKMLEPDMTDEHWQRRSCNIPTRMGGAGITPDEWDALEARDLVPDRQKRAYGWIDLAWKIDTCAFGVLVWEGLTRRVITGVHILVPEVDEADVVRGIIALQREFGCVGWVYDPNTGGRQMAQLLEKGEHPQQDGVELAFIEHSQENVPMALAANRLDEAIRNRWLVHDGDRELRSQVLNAVKRPIGVERHRYDRPADAKGERRAKYPIDALTGLLMGHSVAVAENEKPSSMPMIGVAKR